MSKEQTKICQMQYFYRKANLTWDIVLVYA